MQGGYIFFLIIGYDDGVLGGLHMQSSWPCALPLEAYTAMSCGVTFYGVTRRRAFPAWWGENATLCMSLAPVSHCPSLSELFVTGRSYAGV